MKLEKEMMKKMDKEKVVDVNFIPCKLKIKRVSSFGHLYSFFGCQGNPQSFLDLSLRLI